MASGIDLFPDAISICQLAMISYYLLHLAMYINANQYAKSFPAPTF